MKGSSTFKTNFTAIRHTIFLPMVNVKALQVDVMSVKAACVHSILLGICANISILSLKENAEYLAISIFIILYIKNLPPPLNKSMNFLQIVTRGCNQGTLKSGTRDGWNFFYFWVSLDGIEVMRHGTLRSTSWSCYPMVQLRCLSSKNHVYFKLIMRGKKKKL